MRVFIAIDLNEELKGNVLEIENKLKREDVDVKFVEHENLHLTLKFLGEVDENQIEEVSERISDALSSFTQFHLSIEDFGYFGSPNYIRTLWLDVKSGKDKLVEMINDLNKNLNYIKKEEYKPSPHLTIGRVKSGRNREILLREVERLKHVKIGDMLVKEVKLKQSVLTKKGPIYNDFKVFNLR